MATAKVNRVIDDAVYSYASIFRNETKYIKPKVRLFQLTSTGTNSRDSSCETASEVNMKYALFLIVVACCSDAFGINTVSNLNVTKYLGRWYQVRWADSK